MKKLNIITLVIFVSFLSGCAVQSGNQALAKQSRKDLCSSLVKGKTTEEEILNMFGEPDDTDILEDGRVKWTYVHVRSALNTASYIPVVNWFTKGTNDTKRKLKIVLKDGVLQHYSFSTAKGETTGGLLS